MYVRCAEAWEGTGGSYRAAYFPDVAQGAHTVAYEDISRSTVVNRAGENGARVHRDRPWRPSLRGRPIEDACELVHAAAVITHVEDVNGIRVNVEGRRLRIRGRPAAERNTAHTTPGWACRPVRAHSKRIRGRDGVAGSGAISSIPLQNAKHRVRADVLHERHLRAVPRENNRGHSRARPRKIRPIDRWPVLG